MLLVASSREIIDECGVKIDNAQKISFKTRCKIQKKRNKKKRKKMCWIYVVLYSYVCNYMSLQKSLSSIKIVGVVVLFSTTVRLSSVVSHAALSA